MSRRDVGIGGLSGLIDVVAVANHLAGFSRQLTPFDICWSVVSGITTKDHQIVIILEVGGQIGDGTVPAWLGLLQLESRSNIAKQRVHRHGGQMHFLGLTVAGYNQGLVAALGQAHQVSHTLLHPVGCVGLLFTLGCMAFWKILIEITS